MAMERAVANPYFALCFILAASVPTVNAFPYTYYQTAYFQQSTAIGSITEAIAVRLINLVLLH